ncbi:MAG: hypothetical protein GY903_17575 [Fuerstiella sp.]|nr:hypothetical protein [Fuerstiella sp.]MCP4856294.1 hypothetical protein [Fuerstiella sp.]
MIEAVANLFSRRKPRQKAVLALARIISRHEMAGLGYEQGIADDRRARDERHVALGVWLFPCEAADLAEDVDLSFGVPAVTHDIRSEGFGVMTPVKLKCDYFVIAVPCEDTDDWQFFRCRVCHNTRTPGSWFQLGIHVERSIELECSQRLAFREHIERVEASTSIPI